LNKERKKARKFASKFNFKSRLLGFFNGLEFGSIFSASYTVRCPFFPFLISSIFHLKQPYSRAAAEQGFNYLLSLRDQGRKL
jgi:hypothetical protein